MKHILLTALVAVLSFPAHAASNCGTHAQITALLADEYAELVVAVGVAATGGLLEVLASADNSTWTVIYTEPSGFPTCALAAGEDWQRLTPVRGNPT